MSSTEAEIYALSLEELKEQARILGISLKGNPSEDTVREKIFDALGMKDKKAEEALDSQAKKKGWIKITIHEDEKDPHPAFVGYNGKSYRIRRGEPVAVPPQLIEILENAKQKIFVQQRDGSMKEKIVPTYPFSIHAA